MRRHAEDDPEAQGTQDKTETETDPESSEPSPGPESPPEAAPDPSPEPSFRPGDLVLAPYIYGADVILQVVQPGDKLTFVVGDVFQDPQPVLTSDLQPLQDAMEEAPAETVEAIRSHVHRTAKRARTVVANEIGVLRLQMLEEGLDRLQSEIVGFGMGAGLVTTFKSLQGMVTKLLQERQSSRQERGDYPYETDAFFDYN